MNHEEYKILNEILDELIGTCEPTTFEQELYKKGLPSNYEYLDYLEKNCFCCVECGWWFDEEDYADNGECIECYEDI